MKAEALPRSGTSLSPGLLTAPHLLAQDLLIRLFWTGGLIFFFFFFNSSIVALRASSVAQMIKKICLQCGRPKFDSWVGKIPWRRKWQPTPVFLPGEFHGQRSLESYTPWGRKESDTTKQLTHTQHTLLLYQVVLVSAEASFSKTKFSHLTTLQFLPNCVLPQFPHLSYTGGLDFWIKVCCLPVNMCKVLRTMWTPALHNFADCYWASLVAQW